MARENPPELDATPAGGRPTQRICRPVSSAKDAAVGSNVMRTQPWRAVVALEIEAPNVKSRIAQGVPQERPAKAMGDGQGGRKHRAVDIDDRPSRRMIFNLASRKSQKE
jgi:hypothetical protein